MKALNHARIAEPNKLVLAEIIIFKLFTSRIDAKIVRTRFTGGRGGFRKRFMSSLSMDMF